MAVAFSDPAENAIAVTPSDSVDLTGAPCRALYIGTGGNLSVIIGGATVTFSNVAGGILPIRASRVRATGTTATNIVALY